MTNKERYMEWVLKQDFVPLMLQPWWMDAVCAGKEWDVLLAEDSEGNILGAMPYLLRKRAWLRYILMPQMTQIGGIWVNADTTADRWACAEVCRQLAEQLAAMNLAYYYQQYMPNSLCVEAMRALGFKTKERITYRVDDLSNLDRLIESFSKNKRRQLQKSLSLHAEKTMPIEDFYRFHTLCMNERGRKLSYSREFLLVLERKTRRAGQSAFIRIRNGEQTVAAAFLVWDKRYMYYLIPAYLPSAADTGASALLANEAILLAKSKGLQFDFEGGNDDQGIANHYRQFGSAPVNYFNVSKLYRPSFALLLWLNKKLEHVKGFN